MREEEEGEEVLQHALEIEVCEYTSEQVAGCMADV